jgi:hypothetical protein
MVRKGRFYGGGGSAPWEAASFAQAARNEALAAAAEIAAAIPRALLDYFLCWYVFKGLHPSAGPGMVPCNGTLLADADVNYPKAWEYLQTAAGQQLCVSEAEWQALNTAVFFTDAEGNPHGWNGVGGAPKFVLDLAARTIRVPDLRGMCEEAAGFGGSAPGEARRDEMRLLQGQLGHVATSHTDGYINGVFPEPEKIGHGAFGNTSGTSFGVRLLSMSSERQAPSGPRAAPARWMALACVYLGAGEG